MITEFIQRYALAGAGLALVGMGTLAVVQRLQLADARTALATEQAAHAGDLKRLGDAAMAQTNAFRARELEWRQDQEKHDAEDRIAQAQLVRARDAAVATAAGVQQRFATALAAARREAAAGAAAQPVSPAASAAEGMLADVFGRCVARVRLLAAVADDRGRAGRLCEVSYDDITREGAQP